MKRTSRLMVAAGLVLTLGALPVLAQQHEEAKRKPVQKEAMDQADNAPAGDVQTELAALRHEISAMRSDMRAILRELTALKAAQAQPRAAAKPRTRPRRPAMDLLGKPAPEATVKSLSGDKEIKLGGKSDKVKVAIFYASWCGYCKRALPTLEALNKEYADKNMEVVAISLDAKSGQRAKTEPELIANFEKLGMSSVPTGWDPDKKIGGPYKVSSFPTSFVIGKNGIVEAVHIGGPVDLSKQIQAEVDKLLAGESLVKADAKS
ncbi:MAG TPA: TlpA disulfide reductase family protein [Phycisphaerae bacterium]|nr:TlpA family protein disulfide reductase [Phycisphaerales bacterium]HRX85832.1 TlpA disulfide reductase family protein [Phycisphaerae bacterium]